MAKQRNATRSQGEATHSAAWQRPSKAKLRTVPPGKGPAQSRPAGASPSMAKATRLKAAHSKGSDWQGLAVATPGLARHSTAMATHRLARHRHAVPSMVK